jgi:GNAT superfamily N-acetyltransferase
VILLSVDLAALPDRLPLDLEGRLKALIPSLVARTFLICSDKPEPVGMITIDVFDREVELHEIYIAQQNRQHGYGTKALRALDQLLVDEEMDQLWLYPHSTDGVDTDVLLRWYKRCGFVAHPEEGLVKYYR